MDLIGGKGPIGDYEGENRKPDSFVVIETPQGKAHDDGDYERHNQEP